jgi:acyl-CoA reductase-like NAD-dependent aldehyde dehydrogenase
MTTLTLPPEVNLQGSTMEFLKQGPKRLLIANEWVQAASGETFETVNPATGERLAEVALAGPEDVDKAVQASRQAFEGGPWSKMSGEERGQMLWKLADLIEENSQELAELET